MTYNLNLKIKNFYNSKILLTPYKNINNFSTEKSNSNKPINDSNETLGTNSLFVRFIDYIEPYMYTKEELNEKRSVFSIYEYDDTQKNHPGKGILFHKRLNRRLFNSPVFREHVVEFYEDNKNSPLREYQYEIDDATRFVGEMSVFQFICFNIIMCLIVYISIMHISTYYSLEKIFQLKHLLAGDFLYCIKLTAFFEHDTDILRLQYIGESCFKHLLMEKKQFNLSVYDKIEKSWHLEKINYKKLHDYLNSSK